MSKFEISKASNGEWYFTLKAKNGEVIAVSETYKTKASAKKGIAVAVSLVDSL